MRITRVMSLQVHRSWSAPAEHAAMTGTVQIFSVVPLDQVSGGVVVGVVRARLSRGRLVMR